MRNQSVRVVSAAFLVVATSAAQGGFPFSSTPSARRSEAPAAGPASTTLASSSATAAVLPSANVADAGDLGRTDSLWGPRDATPRQPIGREPVLLQEQDYGLWAQYRQHHGEFIDRMERFDPQIEITAGVFPNQRIGHEPGNYDMFQYGVDADLPVLVSTEGYLLFGVFHKARRYVFSEEFGTAGNAPGVNLPDETLNASGIKLGFGVFLDNNWLFEAEVAPSVWSDLDGGLHHEDLDFPSHAMFTVRTLENLFFKFGARYNQVYEDAPWLPLLGFSLEPLEGLRIDVLLPERFEISVWPSSNLGFLWGAEAVGAEYHVRNSQAQGSQRADVRVQEIVTYLGLMSRFTENLSLTARAGLVLAGDYDLTSGASSFNRTEGALDQAFFADVSFGIGW